jgi:hypothetical protein
MDGIALGMHSFVDHLVGLRGWVVKATFFKGVALGAVVGSLTLVGTAAVAGTGVGAVFNLGKTNTVNGTTALTGSTNGQQLHLVNTSTGSAAAGLGIQTATGKPPLVVNSTTKVTHLNADLLDGINSAALQKRVTAQCANGTAISAVSANGTVSCTTSTVFQIFHSLAIGGSASDPLAPGLALGLSCGSLTDVGFGYANLGSAGTLNLNFTTSGAGHGDETSVYTEPVSAGVIQNQGGPGTELGGQLIFTVTTGSIPVFTRHIITVNLHQSNSSSTCDFTGTAESTATTYRLIKKATK